MASPAFRSVSTATYNTKSNTSVTPPAGLADGDILILSFYKESSGSVSPPSGFTLVEEQNIANPMGQATWWKRASGESGNYVFTHASMACSAVLAAYSGCLASGDPINDSSSASSTSNGQFPAVSVTTTVNECLLVYACAGYSTSSVLPPTSFTERADVSMHAISDLAQSTAGSSGSINSSTTDTGTVSILIALSPVVTETGTLNQHSFRFFNDDGGESAATPKGDINENINLSAGETARLRFLVDATGDASAKKFQLVYSKKPSGGSFGPWTEVT